MVYVGFEIEVEDKQIFDHKKENIYKLIELAYPITKLQIDGPIPRYHTSEYLSGIGKWRIEQDASLINGAEFIMPPLEKDIALETLREFFELIEKAYCKVTDQCGLHLNISGNDQKVNNVNLGYFLSNVNYRLLNKLWPNRVNFNTYCRGPALLINGITYDKRISSLNFYNTPLVDLTQESVERTLLKGHNNMINLCENTHGDRLRFEIRTMGGKDYHKEFKKIEITTNAFAELLEKSYNNNTRINKRMVSYVNRIKKRREPQNNIWIPLSNSSSSIPISNSSSSNSSIPALQTLKTNLNGIKNIHKKDPKEILKSLCNTYGHRVGCCDTFCFFLINRINACLVAWRPHFANNIIKLTNEAIYHFIKYINCNPTVFDEKSCNQLIKKYMTGKITLHSNKIKLTIPKNEQQRDIIWLAKYMHLFNQEIRQEYVDKLSNPMLRFINKYRRKHGKGILRMSQKKLKQLEK